MRLRKNGPCSAKTACLSWQGVRLGQSKQRRSPQLERRSGSVFMCIGEDPPSLSQRSRSASLRIHPQPGTRRTARNRLDDDGSSKLRLTISLEHKINPEQSSVSGDLETRLVTPDYWNKNHYAVPVVGASFTERTIYAASLRRCQFIRAQPRWSG